MSISGITTGGIICDPSSVTISVTVEAQLAGTIQAQETLTGIITEDCAAAAFDVLTFAALPATSLEVGDTVATPSFSATYNRTPTNADLTDDDGSPSRDVTATPAAFNSDGTFSKTANNSSVTFTLTADDGDAPDSSLVVFTWRPRIFTGITNLPGPYSEAEVEALITQGLSSSAAFSGSMSPVTQYIVHAYPDPYGPLLPTNFQIGDFGPGDMTEIQTGLAITNAFGSTQNYRVARSDNLIDTTITGPISFTVTP